MAKSDFCFTYYDGDAARDKAHMNRLERGAYDDFISAQRKFGHLSKKIIQKVLSSDFENCWEALELILKVDGTGNFYIEWLEISIKKAAQHSEHQRENGKKGGRPKSKPKHNPNETQTITQKKPLEDGDGDGNEDEDVKGNGKENEIGDAGKKSLHVQIRELFKTEYKRATSLTYTWGAIDGKKTNDLIAKIKTTLSDKISGYTEQDIFQTFEIFITRLPQWYRKNGFDLKTLVGNYDKIMAELNVKHNGLNIQQAEDDSERFIRAHEYGKNANDNGNHQK